MENHIGLAFTSDAITLSNFQISSEKRLLTNLGKIEYPFHYEENMFFLEENIVRLSNLVLNEFESLHLEPSTISISIESNLSLVKRIEIPNGLNEKEEAEHIQWDLNNSLISSIEDYLYLKTNNFFDRSTHKEVLVVALRKDIIDFFKNFIDFSKIKLNNLSTNNLATELCFLNSVRDNSDDVNILFRINSDRIESLCLFENKLYMSDYEKIKPNLTRSKEEIFLEKITNYKKKTENYFEQLFNTAQEINNIYLYGIGIKESFISLLSKNISPNISKINPLNNISIAGNIADSQNNINDVSGFVECIGITLDSD
jgi:Tfp pilus assembly PilM family ATPase